jgi:hypothetical protein
MFVHYEPKLTLCVCVPSTPNSIEIYSVVSEIDMTFTYVIHTLYIIYSCYMNLYEVFMMSVVVQGVSVLQNDRSK